ncbi:hypothetical protein PR202_ga14711 [Eleusine coracana subsp. coracana]|uniref:SKP1-like protein n=1 Tax=Eleusine coracana subsp. coracana TaxID=191504 RepID=A0AAV5CI96_ELECO|nr:hypothetical protein PR202_ga14711 [Eleusine coracana subsp. coracana]
MAAPESGDGNNGAARMVTLISSDNTRFEVEAAAASLSQTLQLTILDGGGGGGDGIPLPNVDSATLSKVLEYCIKHAPAAANGGAPNATAVDRAELERFDNEFVNIDQSVLYSLIMAAHNLEIEGLQSLVAKKVADMIKGKSPMEIRRTLGFPDPTPEEQAEMNAHMLEYGWAYE